MLVVTGTTAVVLVEFLANVAVILDMKRLAKDNNENLPPF